jgi:tRNA pseudouridine38-40 synthase
MFAQKELLLHKGGTMAYRYFIQLAYNGTAYAGWQIQPNAVTVQQLIQDGLWAISGFKGVVTGCGRTDAGVSASVFYAHFDSEDNLSSKDREQLCYRLNRFLPQDIVIYNIQPVIPGTHARFTAITREYEYLIIRQKDPFRYHQAYFVNGDLDIEIMNKCAAILVGRHDFQCFSKVNTQVNNYLCDIQFAALEEQDHILKFTIRADRFLRNMVRAVVGTLLDVGRGKISSEQFKQIIDSRNRSDAGYSVPAKGLTLKDVQYPEDIFPEAPVYFSPESSEKIISHYYTNPEFHQRSGNETNERSNG